MGSDDDSGDKRKGGVLGPDELDISKRPEVEEIDEGRYIVSASGSPAKKPNRELLENPDWLDERTEESANPPATQSASASSEPADTIQRPAEPPAVELTQESVSEFLAESLAESSGSYGFDATVNVEGKVNRGRMTSDDIGETLETLLRWYAKQTTDEIEPEAVLGIILAGSDLEVEYPVHSAYAMLKQYGLRPDDSIRDLLGAVREEGSFTVPPSKDR